MRQKRLEQARAGRGASGPAALCDRRCRRRFFTRPRSSKPRRNSRCASAARVRLPRVTRTVVPALRFAQEARQRLEETMLGELQAKKRRTEAGGVAAPEPALARPPLVSAQPTAW
jgi:hypothetical protein